jgi:hypothetical protein
MVEKKLNVRANHWSPGRDEDFVRQPPLEELASPFLRLCLPSLTRHSVAASIWPDCGRGIVPVLSSRNCQLENSVIKLWMHKDDFAPLRLKLEIHSPQATKGVRNGFVAVWRRVKHEKTTCACT